MPFNGYSKAEKCNRLFDESEIGLEGIATTKIEHLPEPGRMAILI